MYGGKNINSEGNATFKLLLSLTRVRGIRKHGLALLSGPKQVGEVMEEFPEQCEGIILSARHDGASGVPGRRMPVYRLASALFRLVDLFDTGTPLLLVRARALGHISEVAPASGCTLCVPFQDPANVGAVIRSAAAFGVSRAVILKEAAHPFHPKSVRAAGSSLFRVPLCAGPSIERVASLSLPVVALSAEGTDVGAFPFPKSFCLVPGLEGPGLPESLRRGRALSIPMRGGVESLNAALATGIALFMWSSHPAK